MRPFEFGPQTQARGKLLVILCRLLGCGEQPSATLHFFEHDFTLFTFTHTSSTTTTRVCGARARNYQYCKYNLPIYRPTTSDYHLTTPNLSGIRHSPPSLLHISAFDAHIDAQTTKKRVSALSVVLGILPRSGYHPS